MKKNHVARIALTLVITLPLCSCGDRYLDPSLVLIDEETNLRYAVKQSNTDSLVAVDCYVIPEEWAESESWDLTICPSKEVFGNKVTHFGRNWALKSSDGSGKKAKFEDFDQQLYTMARYFCACFAIRMSKYPKNLKNLHLHFRFENDIVLTSSLSQVAFWVENEDDDSVWKDKTISIDIDAYVADGVKITGVDNEENEKDAWLPPEPIHYECSAKDWGIVKYRGPHTITEYTFSEWGKQHSGETYSN